MNTSAFNRFAIQVQSLLQPVVILALIVASLCAVVATGMAFAGYLPWPEVSVIYGGALYQIGMHLQIGMTAMLLILCLYLPTTWRVRRLEMAHRRFEINMHDVARAYATAHAADRAGTFRMKSEFDSVRERYQFLTAHPDLGAMEPGILEIAAQMSHVSTELAEIYSDEKVSRARAFLQQRHEELQNFDNRIEHATAVTEEITHWSRQLDLEESVARSQIDRLRAQLRDVLPAVLPPAARTSEVQRRLTELAERPAANATPAE